jgi:hypothetical protein
LAPRQTFDRLGDSVFHPGMNTTRRNFLAVMAGAVAGSSLKLHSAEAPRGTFVTKSPAMKLGTVTYNLAQDWDIETIIKNCEAAQFQGVELRTGHKHGVEVPLTKTQRADVKKRFADSKVELMGLGSAFDFHTPDQQKLRKDIDATKEYIVLAQDVGASGVKVRPNGFPKEVPQEKTLEQIGRSLHEIGDFAKEHGQVIRLEVHGTGTSLLPNIKRIIDIAGHKQVGVLLEFKSDRSRRGGLRSQFQSGEGQNSFRPPARFVRRGLSISKTLRAIERNGIHRLLPRRDSGEHRSGARDEIFSSAVAGVSGLL